MAIIFSYTFGNGNDGRKQFVSVSSVQSLLSSTIISALIPSVNEIFSSNLENFSSHVDRVTNTSLKLKRYAIDLVNHIQM